MPSIDRRRFLLGGAGALLAAPAFAQTDHSMHGGQYESLRKPGRMGLPEIAASQHVFDSPAPKAANPGRWITRSPLPLPRSEMAWAVAHAGRMHVVGGYAEQRVDRPYHHVYDQASDRWIDAPPLPRGANHVGVAVLDGRLYAIGGHADQNRKPHDECFVYDLSAGRWSKIAALPKPCGAIACVGGATHAGDHDRALDRARRNGRLPLVGVARRAPGRLGLGAGAGGAPADRAAARLRGERQASREPAGLIS